MYGVDDRLKGRIENIKYCMDVFFGNFYVNFKNVRWFG